MAALTVPSLSIANSQGSLGRWKARTCGRTALAGVVVFEDLHVDEGRLVSVLLL